jgi:DNA primase
MNSLLKKAELLAADLAGANVDVNEGQKALAYLLAQQKPRDFFDYLRTINQHGYTVVRSNRTIGYYRDLQAACERHLQGMEIAEMAQTLGWALRLLRYYRAVPDARPDREPMPAQPAPPPKPAQPTRTLQVGDRFRGKIIRVLPSGHVFMELPEELLDTEEKTFAIDAVQRKQADVVIPAESHTGKGIKVGNVRWVEVVEMHQRGDKLLIEVKPTPSPVKKD